MTYSEEAIRQMLTLYFICGTPNTGDIQTVLRKACQGGITCFQFREKGPHALEGLEKERLATELQAICKSYEVPFIVNDDVDLAERMGADGVHVGQDDMPLELVRKRLPQAIIGTSINSVDELLHTDLSYLDYIGVGPMYATHSKVDAKEVRGPELIDALRTYEPHIPMVAIGGIKRDNAGPVLVKHVDGIAVISGITKMTDIETEVADWVQIMSRNKREL